MRNGFGFRASSLVRRKRGAAGFAALFVSGVAALAIGAAVAEETATVVRFGDHGIVRISAGARVVSLPAPGAAPEDGWLGVLEEGTVEIAALQTLSLEAAGRPVVLVEGVLRARAEADRLDVCLIEGEATVSGEAVEAGRCASWDATGRLQGPDPVVGGLPGPPPGAGVPDTDDDPVARVEALLGAGADDGEGAGGEGGEQGGGAAACLDSDGTGGEAGGIDGTEVPETEIDRSRHRVNLTVTLEGF
jgi:hypothetical protein